MNGRVAKYRKYEGSGSGRIYVPIALAEGLDWRDNDDINIVIKNINGQIGLFLSKKKELSETEK